MQSKFHQTVDVIKDFNFGNSDVNSDPKLTHLKRFHLAGPFGPDVTCYMLDGATQIDDLGLAINWLEPNYCNVQPITDKDYIGIEYLEEIFKVNTLESLSQLHLVGWNTRSRSKLNKECVGYVLAVFWNVLKHLGNFFHWNLKYEEQFEIAEWMTAVDCSIKLEEHLFYPYEVTETFFDDRLTFSCQHPESLFARNLTDLVSEKLGSYDLSFESESELYEDELELLANLQNLLENGIDE